MQLKAVSKVKSRFKLKKPMRKQLQRKWTKQFSLEIPRLTIEFSSLRPCNSTKIMSNSARLKDSLVWMWKQWIVTTLCKQLKERLVLNKAHSSRDLILEKDSIYRFMPRQQPTLKEPRKNGIQSTIKAFQKHWAAPVRKTFQIVRSLSSMTLVLRE